MKWLYSKYPILTIKKLREKKNGFDAKGQKDFTEIKWEGILLFGSGMRQHTGKYADFFVKININDICCNCFITLVIKLIIYIKWHALVAQLVEQLICNQYLLEIILNK